METCKILIIDDEPQVLKALERILHKDYDVATFTDPKVGLKHLQKNTDTQIILCDQRMPDMTGVEFFEKSIAIAPHAMRFLLTGYSDIEAVIDAINRGHVYRYLTKPWDNEGLKLDLKQAIERSEMAEKLRVLDKAKSDFLMLISHELKTPLTVILAYTDALTQSGLSPEQDDFLARILEASKRLEALIQDTVDLASHQTGRLKLQKTKTNLETVIHQAFLSVHAQALQKKITLEDVELKKIEVEGDAAQLQKAIQKLLEFSIITAKEKSKVSIVAFKKKKKTTLSISYTGDVLTHNQMKNLFEPFMVVGDILNHKLGAGTALPITHAIIQAHGGEISITSTKTHGTTFTIVI